MTEQPLEVIVDQHGGFTIKATDEPGQRVGWLEPRQIKMALLKAAINTMTPLIRQALKGTGRSGEQPMSHIIERVFLRMEEALEYERNEGVFKQYADASNFAVLLESVRRTLMFIADQDNYYQIWVGHFFTVIWEEMQRSYQDFSRHDLPENMNIMNDAGDPLTVETSLNDPALRKQLFYWHLTKHPRGPIHDP